MIIIEHLQYIENAFIAVFIESEVFRLFLNEASIDFVEKSEICAHGR